MHELIAIAKFIGVGVFCAFFVLWCGCFYGLRTAAEPGLAANVLARRTVAADRPDPGQGGGLHADVKALGLPERGERNPSAKTLIALDRAPSTSPGAFWTELDRR